MSGLTDVAAFEEGLVDALRECLDVAEAHVEALAGERVDGVSGVTDEHGACPRSIPDVLVGVVEPQRERRRRTRLDRSN